MYANLMWLVLCQRMENERTTKRELNHGNARTRL